MRYKRVQRCISHGIVKSELKSNDIKLTDLKFNNWAPELINGRCAMLGYVAGYGYEIVNHESLSSQFMDKFPYFILLSLLVTIFTLKTGKPTSEDVKINGLTPEAELFNGRAAMIGITCTLMYELMN